MDMETAGMTDVAPVLVRFADAWKQLAHGDLLLFRRRSPISIVGRGCHSHAAKVGFWGSEPFCLEVREWVGGRAVTLDSQVRRYPGRIDVYGTNAGDRWGNYDAHGSVAYMRRFAGCPYGYANVLLAGCLHMPVIRLLMRPDLDDKAADKRPVFCSQAIAMAERIGGNVDVVPNLADRLTEPADLARSPFYAYRFTLMP